MNTLWRIVAIAKELTDGLSEESQATMEEKVPLIEWLKSEVDRAVTSTSVAKDTCEDGVALAQMAAERSSSEIFEK